MPDGKREEPSLGSEDGAVSEILRDGRGIERGGHDEDAQLGTRALKALQEGEREVGVEMSLVEFVEDNCVDALEGRVGEETAGEYALCNETQACAGADLFFKADLIADGCADFFTELRSDSAGGETSGDATWFEDNNCAAEEGEESWWNAGRLPCSGRRLDDKIGRALQGREDLRQNRVHRKCGLSTHWIDRNTGLCAASMRGVGGRRRRARTDPTCRIRFVTK